MAWLAAHEWVALLISAALGACVTALLMVRRYSVQTVTERVVRDNGVEPVRPSGLADVPEGPYGAGSAVALAGGAAPNSSFTIKGNADSGLYHSLESPFYQATIAEIWFDTEERAIAAGFKRWDTNL